MKVVSIIFCVNFLLGLTEYFIVVCFLSAETSKDAAERFLVGTNLSSTFLFIGARGSSVSRA